CARMETAADDGVGVLNRNARAHAAAAHVADDRTRRRTGDIAAARTRRTAFDVLEVAAALRPERTAATGIEIQSVVVRVRDAAASVLQTVHVDRRAVVVFE